MFGASSARNSERCGLSIAQMAWRLGIMPAEYRRIEEEIAWRDCETRKGGRFKNLPHPPRNGMELPSHPRVISRSLS